MIPPLLNELNKVDQFSVNALIYDKGFTPEYKTYDANTGSFVAYDIVNKIAIALWVKDGQLYSVVPGIAASTIAQVRAKIAELAEPNLQPIGLVSLEDTD